MQIDWTRARELNVTVQSRPLDHLFCQAVLPYSNWQWATRCGSESFFSLVGHFGLSPRTIAVGCPNQNGDVESHQGHLKRRLHQHLLLRGSRNFDSEADYDRFVEGVLASANEHRASKVAEELAVMEELPPVRLCEFSEEDCRVGCHSTVRVRHAVYSVPARYIGQRLRARVYEQRVELYRGHERVLEVPRGVGRKPRIDYRHVIDALLRKPGASTLDSLSSEYLNQGLRWRTASLRNYLFPREEVSLSTLETPVDLSVYDGLLAESEVSDAN